LITKIKFPKAVGDFRPFACYSILYGCISKLFYITLKEVLPHLIDSSQYAFIPRRKLMYNMMLYEEISGGYAK